MNTKQLPYILAIAKAGSLTAAAARLNISQPALSKYLSEQEKQFGLDLFLRNKKRLIPTPAGQVYLEAARQILDLQQRTRDSIKAFNSKTRSKIHVGVSPHRGARNLAKSYLIFSKMFPDVDLVPLEGYASQLREYVLEGKTTFALSTCGDSMNPRIRFFPLYEEELLLCVPGFHRLASLSSPDMKNPTVIDLKDVRETPFVLMGENSTVGEVSRRMLHQAGIEPTIIYTSENIMLVTEMLQTGIGVGFIPSYYAEPSSEVVYFRLSERCCHSFGILTTPDHRFSREERYLIYIQMKREGNDFRYSVRWSDELHGIMDEFDGMTTMRSD